MSRTPIFFVIFLLFSISTVFGQAKNNITQDKRLPELVSLHNDMIKNNAIGHRYKIQLFYGSDRDQAVKVREDFKKKFSDYPAQIEFETPNYKVWIGDFRSRLEADRAFAPIKEEFKSAFIFQPN